MKLPSLCCCKQAPIPACFLLFLLAYFSNHVTAGEFENLGIPVKTPRVMDVAVGIDEKQNDVLYFNCAQPGNRLFLLQVHPDTGESRQFGAPVGEGAWAMLVAPDHCVYLGTWESGYLLKFDPRQPEKGLQSLGKPSPTETYIWQLALGGDGRIYGCTYPQARLVRHDPAIGKSEDLGRLDPREMYARSIASSTNGSLYIGIGMNRAQIVRFDPKTGKSDSLLSEEQRPGGVAHVFRTEDGQVYARTGRKYFLCDGATLTPVDETPLRLAPMLKDKRIVANWRASNETIVYELQSPDGTIVEKTAKYQGAGIRIFAVGAGPRGRIFGSTLLPLEMFDYTPLSKTLRHLGNPTDVTGEIYSFATDNKLLYLCAYPSSFLSVYDPAREWNYGKTKDHNPRGIGMMGDGHLRPRAMVMGPDKRVYVGSLPPYGQVGGALGIYDPKAGKVVENYRNLIPQQGISALCVEPKTEKIFGGSSIDAGGGGTPTATECVFFSWNARRKRKEREQVIVAGDRSISALTGVGGKVFGVSRPSNTLFVIDAETSEVLRKAKVPFGPVHEISLGYYAPHERIYGLARNSIFAIDPRNFSMTEVDTSPFPITCGFAVTDSGIYFGSGTQLIRWFWGDR